MRVEHTLDPIYDKFSKILILGSLPSVKSREVGFYYGHPQNRFWKVMEHVFDVELSTVEKKIAFLLKHRIALYDVIASCDIQGSSDQHIKDVIPNDLSKIISESQIEKIYTTGKKAYSLYMKYQYPKTQIPAINLPSTSPANAAYSLEKLVEAYQIIRF